MVLAVLLAQSLASAARSEEPTPHDPLLITDEMKAWIESKVFAGHPESLRARTLMDALNSLDLKYRGGQTGSAADVYAGRKFNCVSFSFLFVGLSRHVGLKTHFLRAVDDPGYSREGELVVVAEHMTAGLMQGVHNRILEFRFLPDPLAHRFQRLTDQQAVALYYSNLGAERLIGGEFETAATYFEMALDRDSNLPEIWVNLGVARRRGGDHQAAERAYLKALEVDPNDSRAYLNLASLMWRLGHANATDRLLRLLEEGDPEDPYAYLVLGDHALRGKRLEDASRFYRQAIRKDRSSGESRAALGLVYFEMGEMKKAHKQMRKALKRDRGHVRTQALAHALEQRDDREQDPNR